MTVKYLAILNISLAHYYNANYMWWLINLFCLLIRWDERVTINFLDVIATFEKLNEYFTIKKCLLVEQKNEHSWSQWKEYLNLRSKMILIFQMFISVKVNTLNWYLKQVFYLHDIDMEITMLI